MKDERGFFDLRSSVNIYLNYDTQKLSNCYNLEEYNKYLEKINQVLLKWLLNKSTKAALSIRFLIYRAGTDFDYMSN